jgi:PAS domain-containing protein
LTNDLLYWMQKPLIKEKDGTILDVNDEFLNLTQLSKNELCGKYIIDVLDELFRCNNKINITTEETQAVLFTKSFDVRFIKIKKHAHYNSTNLYIFNEILFLDNLMLTI